MVTRWMSPFSRASGSMSKKAVASRAPAAKAVAYSASVARFLLASRRMPPVSEKSPPTREHSNTCRTIGMTALSQIFAHNKSLRCAQVFVL